MSFLVVSAELYRFELDDGEGTNLKMALACKRPFLFFPSNDRCPFRTTCLLSYWNGKLKTILSLNLITQILTS